MTDWMKEARMYRTERLADAEPWMHAMKVNEEAGELGRAMLGRGDVAEEAADVAISLLMFCDKVGVDIDDAIAAKFRILWTRP